MSEVIKMLDFKNLFTGTCEKLPEYLDSSLSVADTFPVPSKKVLDVTLSCTEDNMAIGDSTITWYGGTHFIYSKTPGCLPLGNMRLCDA